MPAATKKTPDAVEYDAAVIHPDQTITYCGVVAQEHIDTVRALAALEDVPRHVKEDPRTPGGFFVLRIDGDLDWYQPTGAKPPVPAAPAPGPTESDLPRGLGGTVWIDGAIRLGSGVIGGAMDHPENPPRVVEHTTESPAGGSYLESVASYLMQVSSEPQIIYCPVTDRIGQFGPLNQSARALRNDGDRRTNREGEVCIQWEVLGYAAHPWTDGFDPAAKPAFQRLVAAADSWGVPRVWPAGPPSVYPGGTKSRSRTVWQESGGYFGHCDVPGNDHGDPGAIDTGKVPGGLVVDPAPTLKPGDRGTLGTWPGSPPVKYGHRHAKVKAMQLRCRQAIGATRAKALNPSGATGFYGSETQALVREALKHHKETWSRNADHHDGNVGKVSWHVLDKL
jgi:hypothetical protein